MKKSKLLIIICFIFFPGILFAQSGQSLSNASKKDFFDMSLEDLMNVKLTVASSKALTTRESPGIVTLISEEEIRNSGWRDLMDVLNTIPGFDFGVDVEGVVGMGVRGNWAHEGKFLLLIDGFEMNENLFSSVQFGNHYPLENIKQIEVIRGPGSAMYGGFAEYAVINIITRSGAEINGLSAGSQVSVTTKGISGSHASLILGKQYRDFSFSVASNYGKIKRSDRIYTDIYGNTNDMNTNSEIKNYYTNIGLEYKKLQLRVITDNYHLDANDNYINITPKNSKDKFDSYLVSLKKEWQINKHLGLFPKLIYKQQLPWNVNENENDNTEIEPYNILSEKLLATFGVNYDPTEKLNFSSGVDWTYYLASNRIENQVFSNGKSKFHYTNSAAFIQALIRMRFADFTVGARYNLNSRYNPSFVPRLGITKVYKKFHIKCLYSNAFRTPSTENINYSENLQPEKTNVYEIEGGFKINDYMSVTLNAFCINTSNTIVYYYDDMLQADSYKNYEFTGTQGFELVYKLKNSLGWAEVNYCFYTAKNNIRLENYAVQGNDNVLLGFPAHKINFKGNIILYRNWSLSPSASLYSEKYAYADELNDGTMLIHRLPAAFIGNIFICNKHFLLKRLNAGFGIYNVLNTAQYYVQPYNSLHAPLPGQSREYAIRLTYDLKF